MPKFLTTIRTSAAIEDVIKNAKNRIVLISPFLKLTDILLSRLHDASTRKIPITIIYGKAELKDNQMKLLTSISTVNLLYLENLHAKCYFNEYELVISSMNMYDFSERNNLEMGVLLSLKEDAEAFKLAVEEADYFIRTSTIVGRPKLHNSVINKTGKPIIVSTPIKLPSFNDFKLSARNMDYNNWKEIVNSWIGRIFDYKYARHYLHNGTVYFRTNVLNFGSFFYTEYNKTRFAIKFECNTVFAEFMSANIKELSRETGGNIEFRYPAEDSVEIYIRYDELVLSKDFDFIHNEDLPTMIKTVSCAAFILFCKKCFT